jgi:hypothetical protein
MTDQRKKSPQELRETDLANERMGKNSLQAEDQESVRNQRHAQPDVKRDADADVEDTFRKMDKDVRARTDLGKGATRSAGKDD